ncbi:hypothetical protein [Marinobacterium sp. BA1]|uniref:hypothetical protein n=1 Tax=Marinobacterium sp. BA1 TaxID=3138931 RepID=UPI0032E7DF71
MATLEDINPSMPLELWPYQHDLDAAITQPVDAIEPIILQGADVEAFLQWAKTDYWKPRFEEDLQCISQDSEGRNLLTTWMPLVTFRERFCSGGRQLQSSEIQVLMERIRAQSRNWRSLEVDTVDISGHLITSGQ